MRVVLKGRTSGVLRTELPSDWVNRAIGTSTDLDDEYAVQSC